MDFDADALERLAYYLECIVGRKKIVVVDLFAGGGGFTTGAVQAGAVVALSIDCWEPAGKVHKANHPNVPHLTMFLGPELDDDYNIIKEADIDYEVELIKSYVQPYIDAGYHFHLHGSPPCQAISNASRTEASKGMALVMHFLELVDDLEPDSWSMENVPPMKKLLPSYVPATIINSAELGIPQQRRRCFAGEGWVANPSHTKDEWLGVIDVLPHLNGLMDSGRANAKTTGINPKTGKKEGGSGPLFRELDNASDKDKPSIQEKIDNFETHIVPIIADIDAGFGNEEATYLMAKQMIEAGACAIQIENQVSDEKQCGHQDGKVTVPHADFLAKINAVRYAFLELGVDDGIIVARTDSLGAGLTKQIAITNEEGDLGDQYNSFLDVEEINDKNMNHGDVMISQNGKIVRPKRLPSNLYQFRKGTGEARCILDSITSLQNGADLIWIETEKPHIGQIAAMMNEIKKVIPNAKLVYNNSPSFNWTLNFRQQVFDAMSESGDDVSQYDREDLMNEKYDETELAKLADDKIRTFQADASKEAGIFHHLITLPTYHTAALSTDNLAKEYFGSEGMLGYVANVQRKEIRQGIACVKHQNMSGSDMGDDHKEYFAGEAALKAAGKDNTMNQF